MKAREQEVYRMLSKKVRIDISRPSSTVLEHTDNIIWSYWSGTEMPLSVKIAIYTWRKYNPTFYIVVLNEETVSQYVEVNSFPKLYPRLSQAHKADVIRLAVLEKYGGYWCDASYYLSKGLGQRWTPKNYDIGGYYQDMFTTDKTKPVLENWFLSAPKNSVLVKAWKQEFYRGVDYKNPKLYIRDLEKTVSLQNIRVDLKEYLMMHCAFLKVIQEKQYRIKIYSSCTQNGPMAYMHKFCWIPHMGITYILNSRGELPEAIKLRGGERLVIEKSWCLYTKGGILSRIIYQ